MIDTLLGATQALFVVAWVAVWSVVAVLFLVAPPARRSLFVAAAAVLMVLAALLGPVAGWLVTGAGTSLDDLVFFGTVVETLDHVSKVCVVLAGAGIAIFLRGLRRPPTPL